MQEVVERIRTQIAEHLGTSVDQVKDDSRFEEDLNADSLETVQIMLIAEQESNKEIPDDARENIHTLNDLKKYL